MILPGCSLLPASGPQTSAITADASASQQWYQVIDVDEQVLSALSSRQEASFLSFSEYKAASEPVVGVGDVLKITVWEAPPGNLFNATLSNTSNSIGAAGGTTVPDQVVPRAGTINVPFAGDVKVAGLSPRDIERTIAKRLALKAVDPQVLVNVSKSKGNSVTVSGDAVLGAQVPIGPNNERILDAIAISGGLKAPAHETSVTLVRSNRTVTLPFAMLSQRPAENIRLGPSDILFINRRARTYTILGATGRQAEVPFDAPAISLTQAIARAGGLNDEKADATGVFVFRWESPSQIQSLITGPLYTMPGRGLVPVVYRLNMRDPKGLFLAQAFAVKEGDILFVTTSAATEFAKIMQVFNTAVAPAANGAYLYTTAHP
jgi:polysaccharide export outer membrane protein